MTSILVPCIFAIIFILAGCSFIWRCISMKRRCTCNVDAVCVEIKTKDFRKRYEMSMQSNIQHCPVFQYEYQGELYTASSEIYSSVKTHQIGCGYIISIDPEHPEVLYDNKMSMPTIIIGLSLVGFGVFYLRHLLM